MARRVCTYRRGHAPYRSRPRAPTPSSRAAKIPYEPALDGFRGVLVLAVLLFHSELTWMQGGYLGVSSFFVLSGFLITSLLLAAHRSSGHVDLRAFWVRRLLRLLPCAYLALTAVVLTGPLWLSLDQRERLSADVVAALGYLVNWRFVAGDYAYEQIFSDPSPIQHFWSLAIEGQYYLVYPVLVVIALRLGVGRVGIAVVSALLGLASLGISVLAGPLELGIEHLYYGTDARAVELLVGAVLGALLSLDGAREWRARHDRTLQVAGGVAMVVLIAGFVTVDVQSPWVYRGGFAANAVVSAFILVAAMSSGGWVRASLSVPPLLWLGRISYGVYVYHWPVFLLLNEDVVPGPPVVLFAARFVATTAVAWASWRLVEDPIRRRRPLGAGMAGAAMATTAAIAVLAVWTSPVPPHLQWAAARQAVLGAPTADADGDVAVALFGDSVARSLGKGLEPWLDEQPGVVAVEGMATPSCGVMSFGERENRGSWKSESDRCADMVDRWVESVAASGADVAVVVIGPWEARNWRRHPDGPVVHLGDAPLDRALRDTVLAVVDGLAEHGVSTIWLTSPHFRMKPAKNGRLARSDQDAQTPERIDRLNELLHEVAARRPRRMRVVDLASRMQERPGGEFEPTLRPDGTHLSVRGAYTVASEGLGADILAAAGVVPEVPGVETGGRRIADGRVEVRRGPTAGEPMTLWIDGEPVLGGTNAQLLELAEAIQQAVPIGRAVERPGGRRTARR